MTAQPTYTRWPRMVALLDMNAFFASLEQLDNPYWRGRPIAVTNGTRGTCCITSSYEARAFGVKTGMRLKEAAAICPGLIQAPARPERYAEVSTKIMAAIQDIAPEIEVFSVDEAFIDLTTCQAYYRSDAQKIGRLLKERVYEVSSLLCSVGISGDKSTAKWAAKQNKPNGLTVVEPWRAEEALSSVPVTSLCGVKAGIGGYLAQRGVVTCGDMKKIPISELGRKFGNVGRRIWLMAQAKDPDPVHTSVKDPKSIGHGKVIPPNTQDRGVLAVYLMHMATKLGRRLRKYGYCAQRFRISLLTREGWIAAEMLSETATDDHMVIVGLCERFLTERWRGEGVHQVHIGTHAPLPAASQDDLFTPVDTKRQRINAAIDRINSRYGEFAVCAAPLLHRSDMPNVISPAWKPTGHRETIGY